MTFLLASGGQPLPLFVIPLLAAFMLVSTVGTLLLLRRLQPSDLRQLAETYPDLHGSERQGLELMRHAAFGDGKTKQENAVSFMRLEGQLCLRLSPMVAWFFGAPTRYIAIPFDVIGETDEVLSAGATQLLRVNVRLGERGSEVIAVWLPEVALTPRSRTGT